MPQQEVGEIGKFLFHQFAQGAHIGGDQFPAAPAGKNTKGTILLPGAAMAQVILTADRVAVIGQKTGKPVITAYVLRNAVDDLNHRFGLSLIGEPLGTVDRMLTVAGREGKFAKFCHRNSLHFKSVIYFLSV